MLARRLVEDRRSEPTEYSDRQAWVPDISDGSSHRSGCQDTFQTPDPSHNKTGRRQLHRLISRVPPLRRWPPLRICASNLDSSRGMAKLWRLSRSTETVGVLTGVPVDGGVIFVTAHSPITVVLCSSEAFEDRGLGGQVVSRSTANRVTGHGQNRAAE